MTKKLCEHEFSTIDDRPRVLMFTPRPRKGVVGGVATVTSIIMKSDFLNRHFALTSVDLGEVTLPKALWFRLLNRAYMHLVRWDRSKTIVLARRASRAELEIKTMAPDLVICFFSNVDHFFWLMGRIAEAAGRAHAKLIADYRAGDFDVFWDRLSRRKQRAARQVLERADLILTRNEPASQFFSRIVPSVKVKRIFNPAPTESFVPGNPSQSSARHGAKVVQIAFVGVSSPHNKGAFLLLDAIPHLLGRVSTARVVMAGPDRQGFATTLRKRDRDIQRCVQLTGCMSPEEVRRLFQQSDIFVMPSYSEGFGNALLEAMCCGLACIGTRVGGIPDILAAGECGLLIDPGDYMQLASALIRLAEDGELRERLGRAARKRAEDHYAVPHFERAFEAILNNVLHQEGDIGLRKDVNSRDVS